MVIFIVQLLIILLMSTVGGQFLVTELGKQNEEDNSLQTINLRSLRNRNKEMDEAIQAVQARINYMKNKQQKTVKRVVYVKRKLTSLEATRKQVREERQLSSEEQKKYQEQLEKKAQYNKLIKDHLKFNKKIVMSLMSHKIHEEVKGIKDKKQQLKVQTSIERQSIAEMNGQKANRVRLQYIDAHQKRKLYFLQKLKQFKNYKEQKLKEEIREREKQQMLIMELEEKERTLLERLSNSEKFRMKCQDQYEEARRKYHSFYQAARGISRDSSMEGSKADIFIS